MPEVLKKFGRYILMDHIAQGGMAEIFRARLASVEGGGRILVIKRIQQAYGSNSEFLQMFRAEIKVTMGFNHPNICQLFDFGEEQGQPYIAMEFIDGRNVRQFLTKLNEKKKAFPIEMATHIVEQAAAGLAYAHAFKDKITGEHLNIVHRDVSPQNILVSYDGNAKVIDFGIAKAANNVDSTRAGVIKGKPSYLSPEQITGETLDGRSDLFALGILYWEMLAGKKLFAGENDLATLKLIEACQTHVKPPSSFNPLVPKELDYIVLRALAKNRDKRYQTAEEFHRVLRRFLVTTYPDFSPTDLSNFAKDLFKDEILADRKYLQDLSKKVDVLLFGGPTTQIQADGQGQDDTKADVREDASAMVSASGLVSQSKDRLVAHETEIAADLKLTESVQLDEKDLSAARKKATVPTSRPQVASPAPAAPPLRLEMPSQPSVRTRTNTHTIEVSNAPSRGKGGWLVAGLALVAGIAFGPRVFEMMSPGASPGSEISRTPAAKKSDLPVSQPGSTGVKSSRSVLLKINILPIGADKVAVNGKNLNASAPEIEVQLDTPLELHIEKEGFAPVRRDFVIESRVVAQQNSYVMDVEMDPSRFGFLTLYTTPSDAVVKIDMNGRVLTKSTPFQDLKLPVGTYSLVVSNELLGMERKLVVTIEEGKVTKKTDVRLELKN